MSKPIKGQHLRLKLGTYLAAATSCTIHGAATLNEYTTKDTPDGQTEIDSDGRKYDLSAEALVVDKADIQKWLGAVGERVAFSYNHNDKENAETILCSGYAYIGDVSVAAQDRQHATLSMQLSVDGGLGMPAVAAALSE